MRPTSGRQTCDRCGNFGNAEFKKITELKDPGIALYRYSPQTEDEAQIGTETGEVLILRNTQGGDLKIGEVTAEAGKKTISCPRCIKMIERAKSLFEDLPPAKIREVAGVCDHCYQKELFPCPCCDKIVHKFLKFYLEEERKTEEYRQQYKSWLSKTQLSFKKSVSNIKDGKLESQAPTVSRYIPTMKRGQEPAPFAIYDQPVFKNERELIHEKKQVIEKPTKILSFLDFSEEEKQRVKGESELDREKKKRLTEENAAKALRSVSFEAFSKTDLKPPIEKDKQSTPLMEEHIKSQPTMEQDIETTTVIQKNIMPKSEMEKDSKPTPLTEKYDKPKSTMEKGVKLKSIMKKGGVKKPPHSVFPRDEATPQAKRKRQDSTTRPSFGSIMKSLSEPNVSDFSYTFPVDKIVTKKQLKGHVSSSELIKSTQDMLDERKETERKKKEETSRKREEDKKQRIAEKTRLLEEERKKREEGGDIKSEEIIDKESEQSARRRKQEGMEAIDALKEGLSKEEKESSVAEKIRKQQEKDTAFGDKEAREAEKAIKKARQQLTTDNKTQRPEEKPDDDEDRVRKGGKEKNIDQEQEKVKQRDTGTTTESEKALDATKSKTQRDDGATSVLKEQLAKQAKDKSENEKLRTQKEKDVALVEKRAQEAEKALEATQKQLTTEKKQAKRLSQLKVPDDKKVSEKDDTGKDEKMEKTAKDQKAKGDDMAALLREQLAKQKQQELEKEKIRKEQEKEKELLAKKLKELESQKKAKEAAVKAPVLETELEDSVDEIITDFELPKQDEVMDIILGQKIYKVKCAKKTEDKTPILESKQPRKPGQQSEQKTGKHEPELHKHSELPLEQQQGFTQQKPGQPTLTQSQQKSSTTGDKKTKATDTEAANKGVIRYTLSDRTFIEKGWTMLPMEKVVRKMNVYRMRPAKPEFDWFEHNKNKGELTYDSGEKLAEFDDNGRGRWYYRTGELALDYYDAEETNAGQRFVVYSTSQPDERGRSSPRTLLATFDYSGNGIVFDHTGKIRLKYNQTEGVVLDRTIGPVSHWKWHTLNDPPVLQQVMIDTQMPYKDPTILAMGDKHADAKRPDNEEMLAIEFENFLKEKRQKLTQSFKPFQIKMKAMKINEYFSLRVLDQASIYLLFRDGTTNLKLNIGMVLDHKEIVDTDTAEIGEVSNTLDKLPACTDSIAGLQKAVAKAQAQERFRVRRDLRLKPPQPTASADALRTGCSRPLRTVPVVQASISSCDKMTPKRFKPSSSCNLYYSTQLF